MVTQYIELRVRQHILREELEVSSHMSVNGSGHLSVCQMPWASFEYASQDTGHVCVEICPAVFRHNDADYIEVLELSAYPVSEVEEAIKNCPTDCIGWTEA